MDIRIRRHNRAPGRSVTHTFNVFLGTLDALSGELHADGTVNVLATSKEREGEVRELRGAAGFDAEIRAACAKVDADFDAWLAGAPARKAAREKASADATVKTSTKGKG